MLHTHAFIIRSGLVLLLSFAGTRSSAQTPEENYRRLEGSIVSRNGQPSSYDFSWVTPQLRAELIQYASTTSSNNLPKPQFITPREALLYLADPATIEDQVSNYRKADGKENIWGPPDILPYLVDDLTHASSENHVGVPGSNSLMDTSLIDSCEIIFQWTPFPAKTRKWAADFYRKILGLDYRLGPDSNANRLMREWWEHNKDAVLARQYNKATWLPPASEEVSDGPMASLPSSSPQLKSTQPPPTPAPQVQSSIDTSIPFWVYGIIILSLGLIMGLWYFWRPKK